MLKPKKANNCAACKNKKNTTFQIRQDNKQTNPI